MQTIFEDALISGRIVKSNTFTSDHGDYKIDIIRNKEKLFFFKYKGDELVECLNLSDM